MDRSLFQVGVEHRQGRRHGHNISKGFEANAADARGNKLRIRYPCSGSIPGRNLALGHRGNKNQHCDVTFPCMIIRQLVRQLAVSYRQFVDVIRAR